MHFVTGGAYNGKTKWVKQFYGLNTEGLWLSGYQNDQPDFRDFQKDIVVLQGIDAWIGQDVNIMDVESIQKKWKEILDGWRIWEKEESGRTCVVIGSDLSKGIVPIEKKNRQWRDACGWIFQDVASISTRVDIIWYGINQRIK
ncbi:bifunctional adenosylcobinamide kinase/adenosylcobinamide-phosphate guanylyltransferase [Peribacillus sp. NPDC097264]|uniref:bifunctional adenosylcobinamide kinase/adenosylcobinamide-phosphate guanylyltransferase n=1 Tax=Peribacillus sp. NPDC097264 TaxID=3390616 RepID=UPI003D033B0C